MISPVTYRPLIIPQTIAIAHDYKLTDLPIYIKLKGCEGKLNIIVKATNLHTCIKNILLHQNFTDSWQFYENLPK